jgi:hypothetical protein
MNSLQSWNAHRKQARPLPTPARAIPTLSAVPSARSDIRAAISHQRLTRDLQASEIRRQLHTLRPPLAATRAAGLQSEALTRHLAATVAAISAPHDSKPAPASASAVAAAAADDGMVTYELYYASAAGAGRAGGERATQLDGRISALEQRIGAPKACHEKEQKIEKAERERGGEGRGFRITNTPR